MLFRSQVLGTKFNISNYKGGATNIVLVEGSVEVTDRNERKAQLVPSDLLNIANGAIAYQKQVDVAEYISWVDGVQHEELFCCHSAEWVEEVRKAVEGDR